MSIQYDLFRQGCIPTTLAKECAALFSESYGVWSTKAPSSLKAGDPVRYSEKRVNNLLASPHALIATAGKLIS
jgi:hypothetical protein